MHARVQIGFLLLVHDMLLCLVLCLHAGRMSRHKGKQFGVPFQHDDDKDLKLTVPGDTYRDPYSLQVRQEHVLCLESA